MTTTPSNMTATRKLGPSAEEVAARELVRLAKELSATLENEAIAKARPPRQIGWVISVEDWALVRRLVADGVPRRQVARDLGIGRSTVDRALASDGPPKYERALQPTSSSPFEARVAVILAEYPEMPATVIAERVGWQGSITWFRDNVRRLRPALRRLDPADRLVWFTKTQYSGDQKMGISSLTTWRRISLST